MNVVYLLILVTDSCTRVVYGNSTHVVRTGVCGKHGTCSVTKDGGFHCTCNPGWTGLRCETGKQLLPAYEHFVCTTFNLL